MRQYIDTLQDVQGNALVGATVLVQNYIGGANASIFSDNGLTPIVTSTVTTGADGQFNFFAADGDYNLVMSKNATIFKTQSPVSLFDGAAQVTAADSGAVNAYAISGSQLEKALRVGLRAFINIANTNTGASTFQYNTLAVKNIVYPGALSLAAGALQSGGIYALEYDGTNWQLLTEGAAASGSYYAKSSAESSAGVTPINFIYPVLTVDRYATNATPGTTDMTAAIKAAWNVAKQQGGGTISFIRGAVYALSSLDAATPSVNLANQNSNGSISTVAYQVQVYCQLGSNIRFDFAGAQIKSTITGGGVAFLFDGCTNIEMLSPNISGTQVQGGGVVTLGTITPGSGYVNGTYTNVLMTGGTGHGCCCTVVVSGGAVTSVTPTYPGGSTSSSLANGYQIGDSLSTSNSNLGGSGTGFAVAVASVLGAGNIVSTASVIPVCVTSLSGQSSGFTTFDLVATKCYMAFAVIDGTNGLISNQISLLGRTVVNGGSEYGIALQNGGDAAFIENLYTYQVNRPYFLYGVQGCTIARVDAEQTNYGFGSVIKAYSRNTCDIIIDGLYRNNPGNPTSRISIQVQCDPAVVAPPPTVKNLFITHDEQNQDGQGVGIEFDYFAGSGGTVQTATSANQLFDQIVLRGICLGYLFSTVQLTAAAAQCQINYDNLEAAWAVIYASGEDVRTGLGFIASRQFFTLTSLTFGGTTVAGTTANTQCTIADGLCKISGNITLTAKNGTGQAAIVLPFKSRLDAVLPPGIGVVIGVSGMVGLTAAPILGELAANSNVMSLVQQAATGTANVADTNFSTTSVIYFDVTYPI